MANRAKLVNLKDNLEMLYARFNRRAFVSPDPLQFLYAYPDAGDREIAGLMAASLAYGNVKQILKSLSVVFEKMGSSPRKFVLESTPGTLRKIFAGFRHRWHTGDDVAYALTGIKFVLEKYGSLEKCFLADGLSHLVSELTRDIPNLRMNFFPSPSRGSACKRLHLFLRWMVREDQVDPGGWKSVSPTQLIIPLDTHMHRIGRKLKLTRRNQGDMKTAMEITEAFRKICPEDPVRYDFTLTRLGIQRIDFHASKNSTIILPVAPQIS
ncbi:MAG: TIGR02757 family protein [Deltaproteobacteria bacterium]|nr:TIGR02757 family protein [Deltaproteobacteria bacterium]